MISHTDLTSDFATTAERLRRSTVHVRSGQMGGGSGVIWGADGLIITNAHVVRGREPSIELWDGREFAAEVLSVDPQRDLAALKILADDLPAAQIADSDSLRVGQMVVAVGNPLGLTGALSMGIVHAIAPAESRGRQLWVQADVRLAPGNSGGPLADVRGQVVGISSMIAGGLGLAVPSNAVRRFLHAGNERPRLGVTTQAVVARVGHRRVAGLLILGAEEGSPAHVAGLSIGDVLLRAAGHALESPADLGASLDEAGPSGALTFDLLRGGQMVVVNVSFPKAESGATVAAQEAA